MSLQDDIVQDIVADIMDMPRLGELWNEMDFTSRFITMDHWRAIVKSRIESAVEELTSE